MFSSRFCVRFGDPLCNTSLFSGNDSLSLGSKSSVDARELDLSASCELSVNESNVNFGCGVSVASSFPLCEVVLEKQNLAFTSQKQLLTFGALYSRTDQVNFVEDSF